MTANITAEKDRLPFLTKLIYGLGDWGNSSTSTILCIDNHIDTMIAHRPSAPSLVAHEAIKFSDHLFKISRGQFQERFGSQTESFNSCAGALPIGDTDPDCDENNSGDKEQNSA